MGNRSRNGKKRDRCKVVFETDAVSCFPRHFYARRPIFKYRSKSSLIVYELAYELGSTGFPEVFSDRTLPVLNCFGTENAFVFETRSPKVQLKCDRQFSSVSSFIGFMDR